MLYTLFGFCVVVLILSGIGVNALFREYSDDGYFDPYEYDEDEEEMKEIKKEKSD